MKINYRPEIDGLRAIAVIGVILYHAKITVLGYQPFKGGFIGVDIFFVITGFLITSILLYEHKQNKTINIINFYERRIRRLLPVLLLVIIIASIFSYFVIDPMKLRDTSLSAFFSSFFPTSSCVKSLSPWKFVYFLIIHVSGFLKKLNTTHHGQF